MQMRRIGVMIGSPGDAASERDAVTEAILRWNASTGWSRKVFFEPVRWETHATPGLSGRPQGMINEELIPRSDALIAILRARAGSPTGLDVSGTIEEIREFMRCGKYAILYFYEGAVELPTVDPDQLAALRNFRAEIQRHGLTESYKTVEELTAKISHHLSAIVGRLLDASPPIDDEPQTSMDRAPIRTPTLDDAEVTHSGTLVAGGGTVEDSGSWVFLDSVFYESRAVRKTASGEWILEIHSESSQDDASLSSLHTEQFGRSRPMPFAFRNDGLVVSVKSLESTSDSTGQLWTITLAPERVSYDGGWQEMEYQTNDKKYSRDDFARLRAGRILLNDPPPLGANHQWTPDEKLEKAMLESLIRGTGRPVPVENCAIRVVHQSYKLAPELFLQIARLASVYVLKAAGVVEHILELKVGPMERDGVHIKFRGRRHRAYSNVEPSLIELEGDCPLN